MKLIPVLFISNLLFAAPQVLTFNKPAPVCSIIDNKLVLARAWPFGSWEDCSYSLVDAAKQLDKLRDDATKQVQVLQSQQSVCKK